MSSSRPTIKQSTRTNSKKEKGAREGKLYEIILLLSLAGKVRELSKKDSRRFCKFTIGREIKIDKYSNIDDVVLSYEDQDKTKNLIFIQLKHMQDNKIIDSEVLSTVAARAKDLKSPHGFMCKDFNLQKYFISFLSVKNELKFTDTKEMKDGKIKYIILFTNVGLESKELVEKGFSLKKAPDDIVDLFTLSSEPQLHSYQLEDVSEALRKILKKSSDLDRLAIELAQYVVYEDFREHRIMGTRETFIKLYHVALEKKVIQKSPKKQVQNGQYFREAQFRGDFLDCDQTASNLHSLRVALFEAVRELDESKKEANDEELKTVLKEAKWKIVYNFEKSKQNSQINFPCEWIPVGDEDIKEFLECFVFIVNQPRVTELELLYKNFIEYAVVDNPLMKQFVDRLNTTGAEFRDCVEKIFGLDIKRHDDEKWISDNQIEAFMKEKQQLLRIMFVVSAMTLMYKNEIRQYGAFKNRRKIITGSVKNFLTSGCKLLCVKTPVTLLSSIKISQQLHREKVYPIFISLNSLNCTENRDCVLKAFELETISLLTIECRHSLKDCDINFLHELVDTVKAKSKKKIILIIEKENYVIFKERFETDVKEMCVLENDFIELKHFEPKEDPLAKKVLVFQGQKEKLSLYHVTGIFSWYSYVDNLCEGNREQGVVDGMTLVKILNNDEMEVGSKPAGTSSLEGAYAQTYEEVNVETLVDRLTSQEDENDVYIISGISGSSKQAKTDKLIQYLGMSNKKEIIEDQLGYIGSDSKIQIADGYFKHKDFQSVCHNCSEKRIFWISITCKNNVVKLILQETYNPKFYLKRKFKISFKKIIFIKKDLKKHLIRDDLSETFIFYCVENKQELYKSMELNELEIEHFKNNSKIRIFIQKCFAEAAFRELSTRNETVHFFEFEENQFVWCASHGSLKNLQKYIDHDRSELQAFGHGGGKLFLIEEDKLIEKLKDRKVVIFADEPGMGKSTTIIKLYETQTESHSMIKSHWVVNIKLRDHLRTVLDHEFEKDGIGILDILEFLSTVDLSLNNNLAKNLLKIVLDKSKSFQAKPLLLIFDGFDEVLDEVCRNQIVLLLQFLKDETAAKIWITTRCHFKNLLEEKLSTIAFQFSPMDDAESAQYIATYLRHRLYLILNNDKYIDLFDTEDENQIDGKIHTYAAAFINKMQSIFRGDISTFIGTPLQLYLMLEGAETDFKIWIEGGDDQISLSEYVRNDVWDIYEYFINKKYDIYFLKIGIRERVRLAREKEHIDRDLKDFAVSKILKENAKSNFEQFKDVFLLVGVIQSQGNAMEFIHKTFEEFFVSKACIDWIKPTTKTDKQEYLCTVILLKPDYQLVRSFIDFQLQKLIEQSTEGERQDELEESLKYFGETVSKLLSKKSSPLTDVKGTLLHIAVNEKNKNIVWFLLKSLEGHPVALRKFLFTVGNFGYINIAGTALHLACWRGDVEIAKVLLDAAEGIPGDTLQGFLKCLDTMGCNVLFIAAINSDQMFKELWERANNKLDLILTDRHSALREACFSGKEEVVDLLLQEFQHEKHSLKKLLLQNGLLGNALYDAGNINIVEKLIAAAKSIEDNNETLKKILLPAEGKPPLNDAVSRNNKDTFEKLLNVAKEIDDDNQTLIQMLLNERYKTTPLLEAAEQGEGCFIKLLLKTASDLGLEILEKLITAVDGNGKNAIDLMIEKGNEAMFDDAFEMLKEDKYKNIRKKVMEMFDNKPLERRLYRTKSNLCDAIRFCDIEEIKNILSNAKNASFNPNLYLRNLLSDVVLMHHILINECESVKSVIIELLSSAMDVDDGGATLRGLLTNIYRNDCKYGCERQIKQTVERFIFEVEIGHRMHAINILKEIKEQFTREQLP